MFIYNAPLERSGNYAFLNALNYIWIPITEDEINALPPFSNLIRAETLIKKKVKALKPVKDVKAVDSWIAKGQMIIAYTTFFNKKLLEWAHQIFDGNDKAFFILYEDCWDMWKILLSLGEDFWDWGFAYIKKTEFEHLSAIRRIVP